MKQRTSKITTRGNHQTATLDSAKAQGFRFPDAKIWVTEYAFAHQTLETTKGFYYESAAYLESSEIVERYSYFGAFRSQVSNVGANATFLNRAGQLTEIGLRYLGLEGNGVEPTSG